MQPFQLLLLLLLVTPPSAADDLRVATAQFDSIANLEQNTQTIRRLITDASIKNSSQIIAFPETALTSYNASYIQTLSQHQIENAVSLIQGTCQKYRIYCIIGTPWWDEKGERLNAAVVIDTKGRLLGYQPKTMLVGPDLSWAKPGQAIHTFNITLPGKSFTASIIICHDVRFAELVRLPVLMGSRVIFYISWEQDDYADGSFPKRDEVTYLANVQARAFENRVWVVHSNAPKNVLNPPAGSHGQSCVISPIGRVVSMASEVGEAVIGMTLNMTRSTAGYALEELWSGSYLKEWWKDGVSKYVTPMVEYTSTTTTMIAIDTSKAIHNIDTKFVSYTLDSSAWRTMNLSNNMFIFLAKQLSPAVLRVGGTQGDYDVYEFGDSGKYFDCNHPPTPMTSYRCKTINETKWRSLVQFSKDTNSKLVFGLNNLYGRPTKTNPEKEQCNKNNGCPPRNQTNIKDFLLWNVKNMPIDSVYGWELGNELNTYLNGNIGAMTQANDLRALKTFIKQIYTNDSQHSFLPLGE